MAPGANEDRLAQRKWIWYYLDASGIMKTGWFKVGQYWYLCIWLLELLAVSTTTPDGYKVNGNGEWVN